MKDNLNVNMNSMSETEQVQLAISDISGYESRGEQGTRNEYYYAHETKEEKLRTIEDSIFNLYNFTLSQEQISRVYLFLEKEFENENERYYAYLSV